MRRPKVKTLVKLRSRLLSMAPGTTNIILETVLSLEPIILGSMVHFQAHLHGLLKLCLFKSLTKSVPYHAVELRWYSRSPFQKQDFRLRGRYLAMWHTKIPVFERTSDAKKPVRDLCSEVAEVVGCEHTSWYSQA